MSPLSINDQVKKQKRQVKKGYPVINKFETIEEVNEYLGGDRIVCLLCGRDMKTLGGHLRQIHDNMTCDQYKKRFGIPWRRGLICKESSKNYANALNKRVENGEDFRSRLPEYRKLAHEAPHRKKCKAVIGAATQRAIGHHGLDYQYKDSDFLIVLQLMVEKQIDLRTLCAENDSIPQETSVYGWLKKHPKMNQKYYDICDSLPYSIQSKCGIMGPRFEKEVKQLHSQGKLPKEIAEITGVTIMTIWRAIKK